MKKVLFSSCLFFLFHFSKAQISFAVTGGLHGASVTPHFLTYPDTVKNTSTQKIGIEFGLTAEIPIKKTLSFCTGLLFSQKGSNSTQFYDTTNLVLNTANLPENKKQKMLSSNTKLNVNYIEIPINLMYKFPLKGKVKLLIGAGPKISFLYNGNTHFSTIKVSQVRLDSAVIYHNNEEINNDLPIGNLSGRYRIFHLGINTFAGLEFGKVFLTANYSSDINAFYEDNGRNFMHKTFGVSLGIYLGKHSNLSSE